jgi:hypothetical protein
MTIELDNSIKFREKLRYENYVSIINLGKNYNKFSEEPRPHLERGIFPVSCVFLKKMN